MAAQRHIPIGTIAFFFSTALGVALTVGCLALAAYWMAENGASGSMAQPLVTASVCIGGLAGGLFATLWGKSHGILNGLAQGAVFAALLFAAAIASDNAAEPLQLIRCAAVLASSTAGGLLGVFRPARRHR